MAREKKKIITNVSREEMENAFAEYAKADSRTKKINAEMELQFTRIREKNQDELERLQAVKEESFDVMQAYATEHPELFTKRKSLETVHGVLGFRTGTPKLKTGKGFTWASVLELLKTFLPSYVRTVEEPAKDKLLADRDDEDVAPLLAKCGIVVAQDESFYAEPKKEN